MSTSKETIYPTLATRIATKGTTELRPGSLVKILLLPRHAQYCDVPQYMRGRYLPGIITKSIRNNHIHQHTILITSGYLKAKRVIVDFLDTGRRPETSFQGAILLPALAHKETELAVRKMLLIHQTSLVGVVRIQNFSIDAQLCTFVNACVKAAKREFE